MSKKDKKHRAAVITRAIRAAYKDHPNVGAYDYSVTDLLTDIRHYCDANGLDFAHLDRIAYSHYCEENGQGAA
jgi:hypothetical protein